MNLWHSSQAASKSARIARRLFQAALLPAILALTACASGPAQPKQRAIESGRNLIQVQRDAEDAYARERYPEAAALYLQLVEAVPGNAELWYRLANTYARTGQEREALLAYERSLTLDPSSSKAWYNMALMLHRQSIAALARGYARANGTDPAVERESMRVLRILREADGRIRQAEAGQPAQAPGMDAPEVTTEVGDDESRP